MGRAPCCEKVGLKKGRWTAQEDEILTNYIRANGEGSWRSLPKNAGLLRCGKSCRLRWINYLRADLKRGNISAQEEEIIIQLQASLGNRWSLIASHLPGRTDNEIKNYWNTHLSRKIYAFRRPVVRVDTHHTPKRKGGRTSRWAMKKNKGCNTQKVPVRERPKETDTDEQNNSNNNNNNNNNNAVTVPVPATPALENESMSTARGIEAEDFMVLDKETDIIMNDGDGVLCFNDTVDGSDCLQEMEGGGGVLILSEERERNDGMECVREANKEMGSGNIYDIREDQEWNCSCSSMASASASAFEENYWEWESSEVQLNPNESDQSESWEHKQTLLSWLWEDDDWESDCQISGEVDPDKLDAMLAWFLS